ncbi:MAG: DUF1343 domain-containing protein [Treponemataceae bacterium]|nr:DUF1343 domain-containing protein [Treponemataceae bacterium]
MTNCGIETFKKDFPKFGKVFKNRSVALITNYSAVDSRFNRTCDILAESVTLRRIFSPEHGMFGTADAGEKVMGETVDPVLGIPVTSLYGATERLTKEMVSGIDLIAFDIQDAGLRFYTYIYTMIYALEFCAENHIPFVIFDRPNPLGGNVVSGNMVRKEQESFIGGYGLVQRYGLTMGELARYVSSEFNLDADLTVIPLSDWKRNFTFADTGLPWVLPSPALSSPEMVFAYAGTCIFEATNVSEGRGTSKPFEIVGAPWIDENRLASLANTRLANDPELKDSVFFRPHQFVPYASKYAGQVCHGVQMHIAPQKAAECPVWKAALILLDVIMETWNKDFEFLPAKKNGNLMPIDYHTGSTTLRKNGINCFMEEILQESSFFSQKIIKMGYKESNSIFLYPQNFNRS